MQILKDSTQFEIIEALKILSSKHELLYICKQTKLQWYYHWCINYSGRY